MRNLRLHESLLAASLMGIVSAVGGCTRSSGAPEVPPDRFCKTILEWLGKAVVDYRAEHGRLPSVGTGPGGLQHSWRVLVAPYMLAYTDHPDTLDYRFDEPWDSPHNRDAFRNSGLAGFLTCPAENRTVDFPFVSYVMLVRPGMEGSDEGFHAGMGLPDDAVLIVESTGCGIEYGEPRDIEMESLFKADSPFGIGRLNSLHPNVVKALRADGKVIDIPKDITKEDLRKLLMGTTPDPRDRP